MKTTGKVTGIVSNLVTVTVDGPVAENELCYITLGETKLLAEVIKVKGRNASVQVFESTRGLKTVILSSLKAGCLRFHWDLVFFQVSMTVFRTIWRRWRACS